MQRKDWRENLQSKLSKRLRRNFCTWPSRKEKNMKIESRLWMIGWWRKNSMKQKRLHTWENSTEERNLNARWEMSKILRHTVTGWGFNLLKRDKPSHTIKESDKLKKRFRLEIGPRGTCRCMTRAWTNKIWNWLKLHRYCKWNKKITINSSNLHTIHWDTKTDSFDLEYSDNCLIQTYFILEKVLVIILKLSSVAKVWFQMQSQIPEYQISIHFQFQYSLGVLGFWGFGVLGLGFRV